MKRLKFFVMGISALILGGAMFTNDNSLKAEVVSLTAPTFTKYDKVYIGNTLHTVTVVGDTYSFLADTEAVTNKTWNDAQTFLTTYNTQFGLLGSKIVSGKITMPSQTEMNAHKASNVLNAAIPTVNNRWWLSDTSSNNRSKYLTATNRFDGTNQIIDAAIQNEVCTTKTTTETGILPTVNKTGEAAVSSKVEVTSADFNVVDIVSTSPTIEANAGNVQGKGYESEDCSGVQRGATVAIQGSSTEIKTTFVNGELWRKPNVAGGNPAVTGRTMKYSGLRASGLIHYEFEPITNITVGYKSPVYTFEKDVCYTFKEPWLDATERYKIKSFKTTLPTRYIWYKITRLNGTLIITPPKTCQGKPHTAGTASVRPQIKLPKADILLGNNKERTYDDIGDKIENVLPQSDGNQFLTLKSNDLKVGLKAGTGVSGTTYTTSVDGNGKISIPVTVATTREGTSYVSAIAVDKASGESKYAVLGSVNGASDTIEVDVSNLYSAGEDTFQITLYQEDSGAFNTAYMSTGTTITVKLLTPQEIDFVTPQTAAGYGEDIMIAAELLSDISKQSTAKIEYSISSGTDKASITSQDYNKTTGQAFATIHPLSGTGSFKIAINKAGGATAGSAIQKEITVTLEKKSITVMPTIPSRVYHVGEIAFTPSSTSLDLENGDVIPNTLKPNLVGIDESTPASPFSGGKVSEAGTWKLVYPSGILDSLTAFTDKYFVNLKEYSVDTPEYVFESILNVIPDDWVVISPAPNDKGWNKTDVVIEPSAGAIAKGYTKVEQVTEAGSVIKTGGSVTLSSEISSIIPYVRLKKGSVDTGIKKLREVKIDKTLPLGTITIENELVWANDKKTVTISPSDAMSGVADASVSNEGSPVAVVKKADGTYTFDATKNGEYETKIRDVAGNERTTTIEVSMITVPSLILEAVAQTKPTPPLSQDIQLTYDAGVSGIKSFKVYYLLDGNYNELEDIDDTGSPKLYKAGMNGMFKFVLENNAGEKKEELVEIRGLTPPLPVTRIDAVWEDDTTKSYTSGTWTNHNVVLKLRNVNAELPSDIPVTWEYSENEGTDWHSMGSDTSKVVSTDAWVKKKLLFRATATTDGGMSANEAANAAVSVNIDKTLPSVPTVKNSAAYGEDKWFGQAVKVDTNALASRPSGISQQVYVRVGESGTWNVVTAGSITVSGNGKHQVYFKAVDAAGNESPETSVVHVNISDEQPDIVIKLNNDPIKSLINNLTFGFFFKDTVNVNIEAVYPSGISGTISYVIDDGEESQMPANGDSRWVVGSSTSINPDTRVMIYAKAESASGNIAKESSLHEVVVDQTKPTITLPSDMSEWTNVTTLDVEVSDDTAGLDMSKVTSCIGGDACVPLILSNGKATIADLEEGTYDVRVLATDYSGNDQSGIVNVKIDTTMPVIGTPSATPGTLAVSQSIAFDASDALSDIASGYPIVKTSTGSDVSVVKTGSSYTFTTIRNGTYVITVKDNAGNEISLNYEERNVSDEGVSDLEVFASVKGVQTLSNAWVKDDITFTISNGLPSGILEKYQFACTDGTLPREADWQDISDPTNRRHIVSAEQKGKSYYFRALPVLPEATISSAFVVNLDKTKPNGLEINFTEKNNNFFARMMNALSFGNWLKEAQEVNFSASDNYSATSDLTYFYAEEIDGVVGVWKKDEGTLSYEEIDIILHAKAVDVAGNESDVIAKDLKIDRVPPVIIGAKDQGEYKHYYMPRFISVEDEGSGVMSASYTMDGGSATAIVDEVKITGVGTYKVDVEDHAGNAVTLTFKIVPLPSLDDIDGTDESKDIIDQVQKELDEIKDKIDQTEKDDYENWVQDANDKWDELRKKVIEDEDKTSKVEGVGDTNFDPRLELIVEEIEEDALPTLPRKALYNYDVYLRKGATIVQPNGDVKVFLPYPEEAQPVVYEVDEGESISELPCIVEGDHVVFTTSVLEKYAISNVDQEEVVDTEMKVPGPDGEMDTEDDVIAKPGPDKEPERRPDGGIDVPDGGSVIYPDGTVIPTPEGGILHPDGSLELPNGDKYNPDGSKEPDKEDMKVPGPDKEMDTKDDVIAKPGPDKEPERRPDGGINVPPGGSVVYPDGTVIPTPDGGILHPDGSLELPNGDKFNPDGSKEPDKEDMKVPGPDKEMDTKDDVIAKPGPDKEPERRPDGGINVPPGGSVVYPDGTEIPTPDGGILHPDGSLELPNGDKFNPDGSKEPDKEDMKVPGPDKEMDTKDDVIAKPGPDKEPERRPDGGINVPPGGSVVYPDGTVIPTPDGGILHPDGSLELPNGDNFNPDGSKKPEDGDVVVPGPDGDNGTDDDVIAKPNPDGDKPKPNPDGSVTVPPGGSVEYPNGDVVQTPDGGTLSPDGSLTLPDGTEYDPSGNKKPKVCNIKDTILNIDTDKDGRPDINVDLDSDCVADINIDKDGDGIPDLDIDTNGDEKADINIDDDIDGTADRYLALFKYWNPKFDVDGTIAYDTMKDIPGDWMLDGSRNPGSSVGGNIFEKLTGAATGEAIKASFWWVVVLLNGVFLWYQLVSKKRKMRNK